MPSETITIARAELTDDVSRALIDSLNAELSGTYSEPGATHFRLDPDEVAGGRGAFLIVYDEGSPVGCGALPLVDAWFRTRDRTGGFLHGRPLFLVMPQATRPIVLNMRLRR